MFPMSGGCHCGAIRAEVELTRPLGEYGPRACDCAFCRKHGAAYLSDPAGALRLRSAPGAATIYHQGSGAAEFLLCGRCGVLVAVSFVRDGRRFGAVNVRALEPADGFAAEVTVSPQTLDAAEKARRWQAFWFADVALDG